MTTVSRLLALLSLGGLSAACSSGLPTSTSTQDSSQFIINGNNVSINEYPYMVSLQRSTGGHFCGGTLLDGNSVITAAHCVDFLSGPAAVEVAINFTNQSSIPPSQIIPVEEIVIIPEWVEDGFGELPDAAILQLNPNTLAQVNLLNSLPKVQLPNATASTGAPSSTAVAIGWGATNDILPGQQGLERSTNALQEGTVSVLDAGQCPVQSEAVTICTSNIAPGSSQRAGICYGDSGGPLLTGNVQIGISSFVTVRCGFRPGFAGFARTTNPNINAFLQGTAASNGSTASLL